MSSHISTLRFEPPIACADPSIGGSVSLSTGTIDGARDVSGAGAFGAGNGVLRLAGDWWPTSNFALRQASVEFDDLVVSQDFASIDPNSPLGPNTSGWISASSVPASYAPA